MLDVQPPPDMSNTIQQLARQFIALMTTVLATVNSTVTDLAGLAYVSTLFVGILLYFTRIEKRLGKSLIKGGAILRVLAEFVLLVILKL